MIVNAYTTADKTYNISDFVNMRSSDEVTYYNYSLLEYISGNEYLVTNILYDYDDELSDMAVTLTLNKEEFEKYKYKPWLLAYDLYGSTEIEFIIMALNGIIDPKDFEFERLKVLTPADTINVLGRIYSANEMLLNSNRTDIKAAIKKDEKGNNIW